MIMIMLNDTLVSCMPSLILCILCCSFARLTIWMQELDVSCLRTEEASGSLFLTSLCASHFLTHRWTTWMNLLPYLTLLWNLWSSLATLLYPNMCSCDMLLSSTTGTQQPLPLHDLPTFDRFCLALILFSLLNKGLDWYFSDRYLPIVVLLFKRLLNDLSICGIVASLKKLSRPLARLALRSPSSVFPYLSPL